MKILEAVLELPAKQHCQSSPFTYLIAMGANNSFYVKSIATYAPTFFGYIISFLAIVGWLFYSRMMNQKVSRFAMAIKQPVLKFLS